MMPNGDDPHDSEGDYGEDGAEEVGAMKKSS